MEKENSETSDASQALPATKRFKPFWPIVAIAVLSMLVGGGLVFALYNQGMEDEINSLMPGVNFSAYKDAMEVKSWSIYENKEYGVEFKYPAKYALNADISNKSGSKFWITLTAPGSEMLKIQISLGTAYDSYSSWATVDYLDFNGIKWEKAEDLSEWGDKNTFLYFSGQTSAIVDKRISSDFEKILSTFKLTSGNLQLIQACPEHWYEDRMPSMGQRAAPKEYYIYKGQRAEIAGFDSVWVKANCKIEKEIVY